LCCVEEGEYAVEVCEGGGEIVWCRDTLIACRGEEVGYVGRAEGGGGEEGLGYGEGYGDGDVETWCAAEDGARGCEPGWGREEGEGDGAGGEEDEEGVE
jgi:hypothetical protein